MNCEKRFVFTGKSQVELEEFKLPEVNAGEIAVKIVATMVSSGTEGIVFERKFTAGNHWDSWVKYPFYPGYSAVGYVSAVGDGVSMFKVGDRVVTRAGHASAAVLPETLCFPIPDEISFETALWFAFAKITAMGARVAQYRLGDRVAVIGAGLIGQFSARWAYAAGAEKVAVIDPALFRLDFLKSAGNFLTLGQALTPETLPELEKLFDGEQPNIVVESTGNAKVFQNALRAVGRFGKLVLMTDTGTPEEQRLCGEMITKGLHIVGAHDPHETTDWNSRIIAKLFFRMCADGRIRIGDMVTHRFDCENPAEIYRVCCEERDKVMGMVVRWSVY